jgi:hypothetical protein
VAFEPPRSPQSIGTTPTQPLPLSEPPQTAIDSTSAAKTKKHNVFTASSLPPPYNRHSHRHTLQPAPFEPPRSPLSIGTTPTQPLPLSEPHAPPIPSAPHPFRIFHDIFQPHLYRHPTTATATATLRNRHHSNRLALLYRLVPQPINHCQSPRHEPPTHRLPREQVLRAAHSPKRAAREALAEAVAAE